MLGDWVEISAVGNRAERLLSGSAASRVQAVPGGFRCVVGMREYRRMLPHAERWGIALEIQRQGGLGFALADYRSRIGLVVGLLVFLFLMAEFENLNWAVKYVGFTQAEQEQVEAVLWENQLNEGQTVTKEKLRRAERQLMDREDFGWVTLNFTKGRLVAERTKAENFSYQSQSYTHHLVSAADAKIIAMDIESGFPQKQVGQTVSAGEVLVTTSKVSRLEEVIIQPTQGQVIGEFMVEYRVSQPLEQPTEIITGQGESWVQLQIGERLFTIRGEEQTGECVPHRKGLVLAGFALPATVITTSYPQKEIQTLMITPKAAEEQARYRCLSVLYDQYPDAEIQWENSEKIIRENVLEYCWKAKIRANIAIEGKDSAPIIATDEER